MIVICQCCKKKEGEKEPLEYRTETHGLCLDCMPGVLRGGGLSEDEINEFMKRWRLVK